MPCCRRGVGDLFRVEYLARRTGRSRATILGTEVVDRWLDWWGWFPCSRSWPGTGGLPRWLETGSAGGGLALAASGLAHGGPLPPRLTSPGRVTTGRRLPRASGRPAVVPDAKDARRLLSSSHPFRGSGRRSRSSSPRTPFDIRVTFASAFWVLVGLQLRDADPLPGWRRFGRGGRHGSARSSSGSTSRQRSLSCSSITSLSCCRPSRWGHGNPRWRARASTPIAAAGSPSATSLRA